MNRRLDDPAELWAAFFVRRRAGLSAYALSLIGNAADAEDLIQDVLVRMVRDKRAAEMPAAYVFRCLRNRAIDLRRARRGRPDETPVEHCSTAFLDDRAEELERRERAERLKTALDRLGDRQREAIVLKIYCDVTFADISEILNAPLATVTSHYRRGIEKLRQCFEGESHDT